MEHVQKKNDCRVLKKSFGSSVGLFLSIHAEFSTDIHKFTREFAALNEAGIDVLDTLNNVAANSYKLLKLGGPVSSLIAAGLDIVFDPASDEQKAIRELHTEMTKQFKVLNVRIERLEKSLLKDMIVLDYMNKVTLNLKILFREFGRVTDPDRMRHLYKDEFMLACKNSNNNPEAIFEYLDVIFRENCPLPTKAQVKLFVQAQRAFRHIESRIQGILTRITLVEKDEANKLIDKLESIYAPTQEEVEKMFCDLAINRAFSEPIDKPCMLDLVNNANNYIRVNLLATVQELTMDLMKTELITMACANVTTGGDEQEIEKIMNETTEIVKRIAEHVVLWVRKVQSLSWPEVAIETSKKVLGNDPIPFFLFNDLASKVREEFEKRGTENDSYQILITETKEMDVYWTVLTVRPEIYANFTNYGGIDCHVFRASDRGASDRAKNANEWFAKNRDALWQGLKGGMAVQSTREILTYLRKKIGLVVGKHVYRSAILLRNKAFLAGNAKINVGHAFSMVLCSKVASDVDFFQNDFYAYS